MPRRRARPNYIMLLYPSGILRRGCSLQISHQKWRDTGVRGRRSNARIFQQPRGLTHAEVRKYVAPDC